MIIIFKRNHEYLRRPLYMSSADFKKFLKNQAPTSSFAALDTAKNTDATYYGTWKKKGKK